MRCVRIAALAFVMTGATHGTAQEPTGLIVRNPYYHPEPAPVVAPPVVSPVASLPAPQSPPVRTVSSGEMMRALHHAVQTSPTVLQNRNPSENTTPGRFVPAADAAPLFAAQVQTPVDRPILRTSAEAAFGAARASVKPATRLDSLTAAVDANLEVTRLTSNPLREAAPVVEAAPTRTANPLR